MQLFWLPDNINKGHFYIKGSNFLPICNKIKLMIKKFFFLGVRVASLIFYQYCQMIFLLSYTII